MFRCLRELARQNDPSIPLIKYKILNGKIEMRNNNFFIDRG